ncbi:unannotated protein [freshwater metagenome]|uniref:Unannotated protein n=1 Tax=freshwater metagenome TaxID=449393 RepID=A0A6J5ZSG6_9ZZZZ
MEPPKRRSGGFGNCQPGNGRAGQRDRGDAIGLRELRSNVAISEHAGENVGRHASVVEGLVEAHHGERVFQRRLDDDGVAADQRRGALLNVELDREVERKNCRHYAEWLAARVYEVVVNALEALCWQHAPPGGAARLACVAAQQADRCAYLKLRLVYRLPCLRCEQQRQLVALRVEQVGGGFKQRRSIGDGPPRPFRLRLARSSDDHADLIDRGQLNLAEQSSAVRAGDFE